ncbi:hypothetical protein HanIR_Chr16g0836571 [Helianthus annuus]|nr:hypothetical protein HanIR_Chr16g0836571 [Helianthus annuus]KAJ0462096.1 hypothetical protein HanHA89_Chr16g0679571 [Helianthus annuus]
MVWKTQNEKIFKNKPPSLTKLPGDIKAASLFWIRSRAKAHNLEWQRCCRFCFVNLPL